MKIYLPFEKVKEKCNTKFLELFFSLFFLFFFFVFIFLYHSIENLILVPMKSVSIQKNFQVEALYVISIITFFITFSGQSVTARFKGWIQLLPITKKRTLSERRIIGFSNFGLYYVLKNDRHHSRLFQRAVTISEDIFLHIFQHFNKRLN